MAYRNSFRYSIKKIIIFFLLSATYFSLSSCTDNTGKTASSEPGHPYQGQSIMVIAPKLNAGLISGPVIEQAEQFGQQTGARVRVITPGWNETVQKIHQSADDPAINFDVYVITTSWSGALLGSDRVAAVPQWVKDKIDWDDVLPIYKLNILTWNNETFALPYDGDAVTLYYRKDIFDNAEYQKLFFERYGYELKPPVTWSRFNDIAEFFNRWDWDDDGEIEYGMAGSRLKNDVSILIYLSRTAAYAKHPDDRAFYFDPDTLQPRINNPGFIRALEDYIKALDYGPEGMINFDGSDTRSHFVTGKVAMAIDWADIGTFAANSPLSIVRDKVGYAVLPGADQVFNAQSNQWDQQYNAASSMLGNWIILVDKNSRHKKLAFDFAAHMTSPEMTRKLVPIGMNGINPSRHSHFTHPESWRASGFSTDSASRYLDTISQAIANKNHIFDLRIPGSARYYQALDEAIYLALRGELSPTAALNQAAAEWEKITDSLGRENQKKLFGESLNAPMQQP